jgi:hypothetical protein
MSRKANLLALLAAGAVTVLVVAGLSSAASGSAPTNQSPPKITGTSAQVGQTLDASSGSWTGTTPISYSYQWRRCNKNGVGCANIGGADTSTYLIREADLNDTIRVRVTAKNSDGTAQATSDPTATIRAADTTPAPPHTGCPSGNGTIQIANLSAPARLSIATFTSNPQVLTRQVGTLSMTVKVTACNGRPVQGALVYAAAVPFNQFAVAPEVQTDSNGSATINEPQQVGYPASSRQQLLAVFLRARKSGEPQGQGVSTSRLVSFKVSL